LNNRPRFPKQTITQKLCFESATHPITINPDRDRVLKLQQIQNQKRERLGLRINFWFWTKLKVLSTKVLILDSRSSFNFGSQIKNEKRKAFVEIN